MCALLFIGLGIHEDKGVPLLGIDAIERCEVAYVEDYTSPVQKGVIEGLSATTGKEIKLATREFVEDGRAIIDQAGKNDVALITPGDPMIATTHMDLRVRAEKRGVKTQVIHGSSILSAIPGETGLHAYKFGKTVTITRSPPASLATVYNTVYENLANGLHTILLLEYNRQADSQFTPAAALKAMLECEGEFRLDILKPDTFIIVTSRLGSTLQSITAGGIQSLLDQEYGDPPYAVIIPGSLHFTEVDAFKTLLKIDEPCIRDNSQSIPRIVNRMVEKYAEKTKRALRDARSKIGDNEKAEFKDLFENVECYLSDSERFLNQRKDELAILSIGYAEGLLDSLRYTHNLELNW